MLAAVLVLAVPLGWIGREHRRVQERSALVAELSGMGIQPALEEPTAPALWLKKRLPGREGWVRDRIGAGWLSQPTVFLCRGLDDAQVPYAIDRLGRLGTVREIHCEGGTLTEAGMDRLRAGLPGVGVVPRSDPAQHRYFRSKTTGEQFALGALMIEAALALGLLGVVAAVLLQLRSLFRRRRARMA